MRWFPRVLYIGFAMQFVSYGVRPLLSYEALALGGGATELGVIAASFSVLSLVAAVPLGRSIDQWGEVAFVIAGTALLGAVTLVLLAPPHLALLIGCSAGLGLGHLATLTGLQTLIANGTRTTARWASFTVVTSIGITAGPAVAGLLVGGVSAAAADADLVFMLAGGVALAGCLLAASLRFHPGSLATRPPASRVPPARGAFRRVVSVPDMTNAMTASLTVLVAIDLLNAYLPAYGEANGIPVRTVGFLLAAHGASGLLSRVCMVPLVALLTRRRVLAASMLMAAAGMAAVPFTDSVPALFAIVSVVGFGLGLGMPVTLAWVADRAPRDIRGTALGIRLSGNRLGQTVLPPAVGTLAGATGLAAAFLSPALMLAAAGMFVLRATTVTDEG
jgi:MFS family permease